MYVIGKTNADTRKTSGNTILQFETNNNDVSFIRFGEQDVRVGLFAISRKSLSCSENGQTRNFKRILGAKTTANRNISCKRSSAITFTSSDQKYRHVTFIYFILFRFIIKTVTAHAAK